MTQAPQEIVLGAICPERARLLSRVSEAAYAHELVTSRMADRLAENEHDTEEVRALRNEMRFLFSASVTAWNEYRLHISQHRC